MSISHRDSRIEVFAQADAKSGGYVTPSYTLTATRWGRCEAPTGREDFSYGNGLEKEMVEALVTLGDDVTVSKQSLVRTTGAMAGVYRVLAVLPRRRLREVQLLCATADKQKYVLP